MTLEQSIEFIKWWLVEVTQKVSEWKRYLDAAERKEVSREKNNIKSSKNFKLSIRFIIVNMYGYSLIIYKGIYEE